jgi:hypothetical protein
VTPALRARHGSDISVESDTLKAIIFINPYNRVCQDLA